MNTSVARLVRPLVPRDPGEPHRASSPLELLTDLCFVVAVAQAAATLHHGYVEGHAVHALVGYLMAFFAIWWSWLNFSWFGSAYDNDDVVYRLLTILQIVGVLVLAAGVHSIFDGHFGAAILGYVIMRAGLVAQWLRAARHDLPRRRTCLRYATGIVAVQLGWIGFYWLSHVEALRVPGFVVLALADLCVPLVAERAGNTPWHPRHIGDRYAAFYIIVLGETILSATMAIEEGYRANADARASLVVVMISGVLIVFSLWWTYFAHESSAMLERLDGASGVRAFSWGFGHYLIFAAAAAIGAGLAAQVDYLADPEFSETPGAGLLTGAAVALPAAVLLAAMWTFHLRLHDGSLRRALPMLVAGVVVLGSIATPYPGLITGVTLAGMLALEVAIGRTGPATAAARG